MEPVFGATVESGQAVQLFEPTAAEYVFAGHSWHGSLPLSELNDPAGQKSLARQTVAPALAVNPSAQALQEEAWRESEKVSTAHLEHGANPLAPKEPLLQIARQASAEVDPAAGVVNPSAQLEHTLAPWVAYVPAGHTPQLDPAKPAAQIEQSEARAEPLFGVVFPAAQREQEVVRTDSA